MKNNRLKIISIFIIILLALSYGIVFANDELDIKLQKAELSEEYQEWQNLSDEEKAKRIEPARYVVQQQEDTTTYLKNLNNVFRTQSLLRASIPAQYNLKNYIPQNTTIKDQMSTNSCWAFATIGALETNLAIKDYNNSQPAKTYDFSERHMIYSSVRSAFLNNAVNEYGYNMKPSDGGNFYMGIQYIINGLGAVNESDLPFEDNENNINIAQIQNKEVQTTLYEAESFPTVETSNRSQIMDTMKQYIMNNGGLYVNIHGASLADNRNYNNTNGFRNNLLDDDQFILMDGSMIFIECGNDRTHLYITVDVNGFKKRPNRVGHDLFMFQIDKKGKLLPMGAPGTDYYSEDDEYCSTTSVSDMNGAGCTYKALNEKGYFKHLPK